MNKWIICECIVVLMLSLVSFNSVKCVPSAQQEHELMLLDALGRKQLSSNNINAISNNNYESNAIMDMLGRSRFKFQTYKPILFLFLLLMSCNFLKTKENFNSSRFTFAFLFFFFYKTTHNKSWSCGFLEVVFCFISS